MQNTSTMIDLKDILRDAPIFASFAVKDVEAARSFYQGKLGLDVRESEEPGVIEIHGKTSLPVLVYPKPDHQPAVFTVLNLQVRNIDEAVDALIGAGVKMEHYHGENGIETDANGVVRSENDQGPSIAWFRDPSGNIVSILEARGA